MYEQIKLKRNCQYEEETFFKLNFYIHRLRLTQVLEK